MGVIFLDNAATTPLEPRVKEEMIRMMDNFGNPSSTHLSGRGAKVEVEVVRKRIAQAIGAEPGEIFFTSGGTEADNMALFCSVRFRCRTHYYDAYRASRRRSSCRIYGRAR